MKIAHIPYNPMGAGGVNRVIGDLIKHSKNELASPEEADFIHLWGAGQVDTEKPVIHSVVGLYFEEDADGFGDATDLMPWSSMQDMNRQVVENSKKADLVVFDGRFLQATYQNWGIDVDSKLIPNAIEPWDEQRPKLKGKILFYGSGRKVKRPDVAIDLARLMPEYEFAMVGQGCDPATLRVKYGFHSPIPKNVTAFGPLSKEEVMTLAESVYLAVFPAVNDASSATIREVMSMGIPVIASDCLGHREVLEGLSLIDYLCPPKADDFRDAIKDFESYGRKDYDIIRSSCANQIRDKFDIKSYARKFDQLYSEFG